jgi:hypothetical protein
LNPQNFAKKNGKPHNAAQIKSQISVPSSAELIVAYFRNPGARRCAERPTSASAENEYAHANRIRNRSLRWSWRIFILRFYKDAAPTALAKESRSKFILIFA